MAFLRRREHDRSRPARHPAPAPFEVRIGADGTCAVGGMALAAGEDEALHETVLDYLHRLAMATGHPVLATVYDGRSGFVTPLEVRVDGSSRFAGEPVHDAGLAARAASAPGRVPAQAGAQGPPSAPAPGPGSVPSAPDPAAMPMETPAAGAASAPAPEAAPAPVPEPSPAPTAGAPAPPGDPAVPDVPASLSDAVARINDAVRLGRIESAAAMAHQSAASAAQTLGEGHPHVLHLQELCAYVAYLAGDPGRSVAISLDAARAWHRQGDPRAYQSVLQAAAAWRAVPDPREGLRIGEELIALWSGLASAAGPAAADLTRLEAARRRMDRLAARASGHPGSAAARSR